MNKYEYYPIPPNVNVTKFKCIQLMIPDDFYYEAMFRGQLWMLCQWYSYDRDDAKNGRLVANIWKKSFDTVKDCDSAPSTGVEIEDCMRLRVNPDNSCQLQIECIPDQWELFWDISSCITSMSGQQGSDGGQPSPGTSQQYCLDVPANAPYNLPVAVNSGDIIETQSIGGNWTDNSAFFSYWYCADGGHYVLGGCIGGGAPSAGDPLASANHMALLLNINGVYLDISKIGQVVVPPGITNGQATLVPNLHGSVTPAGSVNVCLKLTAGKTNIALTYGHGSGPATCQFGDTITITAQCISTEDAVLVTFSQPVKLTILGAVGFLWHVPPPSNNLWAYTDPGGGGHNSGGGTVNNQPTDFPPATALTAFSITDNQPGCAGAYTIQVKVEAI